MDDLSSGTTRWYERLRGASSPVYKRVVYWFLRPALSFQASRHLSPAALSLQALSMVLPERGFPLETRRNWANRYARLRGKTVLILGAGTGWEAVTWTAFRPRLTIALDLFPFFDAWRDIRRRDARIAFLLAANEHLPLADGSLDFIASDAVLEHCSDVANVMRAAFRALAPGGHFYATYGPMWFCFGGDHFSGRGGLTHGFSHVELEAGEYRHYFEAHKLRQEDTQSGGRYVELDLFSKWTTAQYLSCFVETGFEIKELMLEISGDAVAFRQHWPERFDAIARRHAVTPDDLVIKANFVILKRPAH